MNRILGFVLGVLLCFASEAQAVVQFNFAVNGLQAVPPTDYPFDGVGCLTLDGNSLSGAVSFLLLPWSSVGFIRGPALPGGSGPILFELGPPQQETPFPPISLGSSYWILHCRLAQEQAAPITSGLWYVEVTSNEFPNGLVRGQILPSTPVITRQPVGGNVVVGDGFPLSAGVLGSPSPSLQWRFNGTNIANATDTNYTLQASSTNQTGVYTLLAWTTYGTNVSDDAYIKVWPSGSPWLRAWLYSNGAFLFQQSDVSNCSYIVQATTNLAGTNWLAIQTNRAPYTFTDSQATNYPLRFYRTLLLGQ